jgi:GNAT superfamily N-acetyltransferase
MAAAHLVREDGPVKVWELLGSGDDARVDAMCQLYAKLFPQYAHYVPRMKRRAKFGLEKREGHIVHYWLVEVNDQPAAIRTFRYVRARHCGLAHTLAVDPKYREVTVGGQRLSIYLVHACLDQIIANAAELGDSPALGMVNEVESPRLMEHYKRNGIIQLPVTYAEPIFPAEQVGRTREQEIEQIHFSPMYLGFLPNPELDSQVYSASMIADLALAFLVDHYGLPLDHPRVQAVLQSIPLEEKNYD